MWGRRCGNQEDFKRTEKDRKANAPQELPRQRPRALTCPIPASSIRSWNPFKRSERQQTCEQLQSPFFARLPYEIRLRIWSEVLGGHLLHIARAHKRLVAIKCEEPLDSDHMTTFHNCWGNAPRKISGGRMPSYYIGPYRDHPARPANLVPLLRTCRLVYTETVSILYSGNIFDINHIDTLIYLQRSVLPRRLNHIRAVNLIWHFKYGSGCTNAPYDLATWVEICDVLAGFSGLRELTIHLTSVDLFPAAKYYGRPLEALKRIKVSGRFNVYLPWTEQDCAEVTKGEKYPFTLLPYVKAPDLVHSRG